MRAKIKLNALISQDFGIGRWPATKSGEAVDPDVIFDCAWTGEWWDCRATGFGDKKHYGNGSIFVHDQDGISAI